MSHVEPVHPDDIEDYEAFAGVVRSSHPRRFEFTSVGDATLKGFDEPVALYEVRAG